MYKQGPNPLSGVIRAAALTISGNLFIDLVQGKYKEQGKRGRESQLAEVCALLDLGRMKREILQHLRTKKRVGKEKRAQNLNSSVIPSDPPYKE